MTYTNKFPLTKDWQEVEFMGIQEQSGKFGLYYEMYIRKDGIRYHVNITKDQYDIGSSGRSFMKLKDFKMEHKILLRKVGSSYLITEWNYTEEDYRKMPVHHVK
jgi:hypothetical protein